ncbi:MAG: hypothetical protein ACQESR_06145 [Planctomycetota bacterium]
MEMTKRVTDMDENSCRHGAAVTVSASCCPPTFLAIDAGQRDARYDGVVRAGGRSMDREAAASSEMGIMGNELLEHARRGSWGYSVIRMGRF